MNRSKAFRRICQRPILVIAIVLAIAPNLLSMRTQVTAPPRPPGISGGSVAYPSGPIGPNKTIKL